MTETKRIVEGSENSLEKEILNKMENYKETIAISEERPNETIVRKVEERQGVTYEVEEDRNSSVNRNSKIVFPEESMDEEEKKQILSKMKRKVSGKEKTKN